MSYRDAIRFLYSLQSFGIKLGLRNISSVLRETGDPQQYFRTIHIAGTNGKGSCAALVESVLRSAGYRTGLYTSPHLFDFTERIRINGRPLQHRRVSSGVAMLRPSIERYRCTFFEAATALAFHAFRQEAIDVAVIEVGMGGRLDATNVLAPLCTIITDIDYDHTEYLGSTLKQIALEKAAVIKRNGIVVTSVTDPALLRVIENVSHKQEATLYAAGHQCAVRARKLTLAGSTVDIRTPFHSHRGLRIALPGKHQIRNLGAAVLALDLLRENGLKLRQQDIREGLAAAVWPGRLQVLQCDPLFIVDGAHNPGGMATLKEALLELFSYKNLILIIGVMADKQYTDMIRRIVPLARQTIVTKPKMDRALDEGILAQEVRMMGGHVETAPSVSKAVKRAMELASKEDAVCATGSLFLVGEILKKRFGRAEALFGFN